MPRICQIKFEKCSLACHQLSIGSCIQDITGLIATIKLKTPSAKTDQQKTGKGNQKMVRQVETSALFPLKPGFFCAMDR